MAPLKNRSQLAELVAEIQPQVEHQVESKLRRTLVAVAERVVVVVAEPPSGLFAVVSYQQTAVVAAERNFENLYRELVD